MIDLDELERIARAAVLGPCADPTKVLALIAEVRRLRSDNEELIEQNSILRSNINEMIEAAQGE